MPTSLETEPRGRRLVISEFLFCVVSMFSFLGIPEIATTGEHFLARK